MGSLILAEHSRMTTSRLGGAQTADQFKPFLLAESRQMAPDPDQKTGQGAEPLPARAAGDRRAITNQDAGLIHDPVNPAGRAQQTEPGTADGKFIAAAQVVLNGKCHKSVTGPGQKRRVGGIKRSVHDRGYSYAPMPLTGKPCLAVAQDLRDNASACILNASNAF